MPLHKPHRLNCHARLDPLGGQRSSRNSRSGTRRGVRRWTHLPESEGGMPRLACSARRHRKTAERLRVDHQRRGEKAHERKRLPHIRRRLTQGCGGSSRSSLRLGATRGWRGRRCDSEPAAERRQGRVRRRAAIASQALISQSSAAVLSAVPTRCCSGADRPAASVRKARLRHGPIRSRKRVPKADFLGEKPSGPPSRG